MNQAFLFDLDGVLVDSEREYTRIWQHIDDVYPTGVENFSTKIKGTTLPNILDTYYPDLAIRSKVENLLYEQERKMVYSYCPGARELLDGLRADGVPMALVTSSNDVKMEHLYRDLPEIRDYFDTIIDAHDVTRSKPDPQGYLFGAERLGLDIHRCIVMEDSLQGVKAGRSAGAYVVGVAGTLPADVIAPYSDEVDTTLEGFDFRRALAACARKADGKKA